MLTACSKRCTFPEPRDPLCVQAPVSPVGLGQGDHTATPMPLLPAGPGVTQSSVPDGGLLPPVRSVDLTG